MNIVDQIWKRMNPSAIALYDGDVSMSYQQVHDEVQQIVGWIRRRVNVHAGMRVALVCATGHRYIIAGLAIMQSGACFVPVPDELNQVEKQELLTRTATHAILQIDDSMQLIKRDMVAGFDELVFASLQPALIRFSSGTTGHCKGVVISHQKLLARICAANQALGIGPTDRIMWILPMAHHFAVSIILYLYHGACTVLDQTHIAETILAQCQRHDVTVMYAAPYHYALLTANAKKTTLPHVRLAVCTASALHRSLAEKFHQTFAMPLTQAMGIIECGLPLINLGGEMDAPEAVGRPIAGYEARLHHAVDGVGELHLRGPGFFDAYLDPWTLRDEANDPWFVTGDMARQDQQGRFYLCGKRVAVINIGGMKLFPEEVECVLLQHPLVKRCRVIGIPHAMLGQIACAEVETIDHVALPMAELKQLCRDALSNWKVPAMFKHMQSIPTTASGKILRHDASSSESNKK
jgi:acyl-coenzyme A synthetase/AMP-(fatty) acid ligase